MSVLKTCLLVALLALPVTAAAAKQPKTAHAPTRSQLYRALAQAATPMEARGIEAQLVKRWAHTDSPSTALIFAQAARLMTLGEVAHAKEKLDGLTAIAPDFIEGWSLRALANRQLGDYPLAIADLEHVLTIDPKHFRALELLGTIFEELDEPKSALKAFKAAVKINPQMEGVAAAVRRLTDKVKGRGI